MEEIPLLSDLPSPSEEISLNQLLIRVTKWRHDREELIALLKTTREELLEIHQKVNICKVAGSSTSIVGGVLTIVGLALIPVTLGGSMAIAVAGGIVGGAGGITSGAPAVYEHVKQHKSYSLVLEKVKEDLSQLKLLSNQLRELYPDSNAEFIINRLGLLLGANKSGAGAIFQSVMVAKNGLWNMILCPVLDTASLAKAAANVGKVGGTIGARAAGLVISSIMIPVDIASLAIAATDLHQKNIPNVCKEIEKVASQLQEPLTEALSIALQLADGDEEVNDNQVSFAFLTLLTLDVV